MGELTRDNFARNAYRTLGLSGAATQDALDAAARRMRLWPDPSRIPPTPWDVPAWGAVPRSRTDVEQAVARLTDPATRVHERFRWYVGASLTSADGSEDSSPSGRHDSAVSALHAAATTETFEVDRWDAAAKRLEELGTSPGWIETHTALEAGGDFEKCALPHEVRDAAAELQADVVAAFADEAVRALRESNLAAFGRLRSHLGRVEPARRMGLADWIEDTLEVRRRESDADLRDKLRTRADAPWQFYEANHLAVARSAALFNRHFEPLLGALADLVPGDTDRLLRARSGAATYLILIALGWEWANCWREAEDALERALVLAAGSVVELQVRVELERVRPRAEHERLLAERLIHGHRRSLEEGAAAAAGEASFTSQSPTPAVVHPVGRETGAGSKLAAKRQVQPSGKRPGFVMMLFVMILVAVIRALVPGMSSESPPPRPETPDIGSFIARPLLRSAAADDRSPSAEFDKLRRTLELTQPHTPATLPAEDVGESIREP